MLPNRSQRESGFSDGYYGRRFRYSQLPSHKNGTKTPLVDSYRKGYLEGRKQRQIALEKPIDQHFPRWFENVGYWVIAAVLLGTVLYAIHHAL